MPHLVLSVKLEKETLDTFRSLRDLKGCTMSQLLGAVLDEYVEFGLAQADMEGKIEAQTGVLLDCMTGLPEGSAIDELRTIDALVVMSRKKLAYLAQSGPV